MKIRQDGSFGFIGPIPIGGGFRRKLGHRITYPSNRLIEFLKVDARNETEILKFCTEYTFIPRNMIKSRDLVKSFQKEQKEIASIIKKLMDNTATEKDYQKINKNLQKITTQVLPISSSYLSEINKIIGSDATMPQTEKKYLLLADKHAGTIVSLWHDLVQHISEKKDLRECPNCGGFFLLESKHNRRFCTDKCRVENNKRKHSIN